jgi:CRISPR-associated protein Csd1
LIVLLKLLYDLAQSRRLLDDLAFAPKAVRWIIDLDGAGNLRGVGPQATGDERRGKEFICPRTTRKKNVGGVSEFLADGLSGVFGLDPDPGASMSASKRASRDENNMKKCGDFWRQIERAKEILPAKSDIEAMLAFHQQVGHEPPFLRWGVSPEAKPKEKPAWRLRTAAGLEMKLGPENFTFRVDGRMPLENEQLRAYWRQEYANDVSTKEGASDRGICLVTGQPGVTIAATHEPSIRGVRGSQASGAKIVSFEKSAPAFSSYGQAQSLNAPTSNLAAVAYCEALNWLLKRNDHHLNVGATTLCFWARESEKATGLFEQLLNNPDPQVVAQFLQSPWAGLERNLARRDQFCAVTLAGNSGRIVIRRWLQIPLYESIDNFKRWFSDLYIEGSANPKTNVPPLAIRQLALCASSLVKKSGRLVADESKLQTDVPTELFIAAIEGASPSAAMLKPILDQLHSRLLRDERYNLLTDQSRFALLKLILNRRRGGDTMEIKPRLTADTEDTAYNSGRLLAVLAAAQDKAHEFKLEGPGVAERYYGTAAVSPASVFPLLLRLNRHHLAKIGKSDRFAGHERFLEDQIQEILCLFKPDKPDAPPRFPRNLDLQAQGRFALGYYQQAAEDSAARNAALGRKTENDAKSNNLHQG